ncbi:MAG: flavodoxin family protein, partial [Treponema socranskii subsp. buccale]
MKAVVIVFSPSGHTLAAARMIRKSIEARGCAADIVNLTKDDTLLFSPVGSENLAAKAGAFDALFIGAPVYAGHAEHTILRTIAMLPPPDEKRSKIAVPFISYGGAHSFVALEEMGRALKRKNYVPVLGIKIASFHTLSRSFRTKISEDRPGDAERRVIEDAASKVVDLCSDRESIRDGSASFAYTKMPMRFILKILSQEKIHAKFKTVSI